LALAIESLFRDHDAAACWGLAEGVAFIVLGTLMHRGKRWASLALMGLFMVNPVATHLIGHMQGHTYPADRVGPWPVAELLAWACWMRVFWVAYRAEQRQAAIAVGG
jgi:hypothetical protein